MREPSIIDRRDIDAAGNRIGSRGSAGNRSRSSGLLCDAGRIRTEPRKLPRCSSNTGAGCPEVVGARMTMPIALLREIRRRALAVTCQTLIRANGIWHLLWQHSMAMFYRLRYCSTRGKIRTGLILWAAIRTPLRCIRRQEMDISTWSSY